MSDEKKRHSDTADSFSDSPTIIGKDAKDIISAAEDADNQLEKTIRLNTSQLAPENNGSDMDATQKIPAKDQLHETSANDSSQQNGSDLQATDMEEDDFSPILINSNNDISDKNEEAAEIKKKKPEKPVQGNKKSGTAGRSGKSSKNKNEQKKQLNYKRIAALSAIIAGIILVVFVILFFIGFSTLQSDAAARNVYIEDLPVGNMTYEQILDNIKNTHLFDEQQVTLRCRGESFTINGSDIGLVASAEDTAQKAFNYAKSGNKLADSMQNTLLIFKKHTIIPVAVVDRDLLASKLNDFGVQIYGELAEHQLVVQANHTVLITPGHTGYDNNPQQAVDEVLNAFSHEKFKNISISSLSSCPPADLTVERVDSEVYMEAKNARYEYDGDTVNIIPDVEGRYINKEEVAPLIANVKEGTEPIEIPWYSQPAEIKEQDLKDKLFADVLATYSTDYGGSTYNRALNVSRSAELLNGAVIAPGDTFSYNSRVGDRTEANGFYSAPEYVGGQTVQGIGGGTCQVSTTLYCAVLYADLNIVSRTNHMFTISYAPLGQDATVSYGSVDFKFLNSTDYPIKISAYTENGAVYTSILGTAWPDGRTVKIKNNVSYGTGTSVSSIRYVYVGDECISEDTLPSSYYKPRNTASGASSAN